MKTSLQVRVCGGRAKAGWLRKGPSDSVSASAEGCLILRGAGGGRGSQRKPSAILAASAMVQVPRNLASSLTFSRGGEEAAEAWVPGNSSYLPGFERFVGLGNSSSPEPHGPAEFL